MVKWVVAAGAFVTVGTGDYDPPTVVGELMVPLPPAADIRLRISANRDAMRARGDFHVEIGVHGERGVATTLRLSPEDFPGEGRELTLPQSAAPSGLAGRSAPSDPADEDAGERTDEDAGTPARPTRSPSGERSGRLGLHIDSATCPASEPCEVTVRVQRDDLPGDSGAPVLAAVRATVSGQYPDRVFCSSPVPEFGKNAAVSVTLDE